MPVGEYEKLLADNPIDPCFVDDFIQWRGSISKEDGLIYKIYCYLTYSFFWDTYDYGEEQNFPWFGNPVCYYYMNDYNSGYIPYDDFCRIAKEEFGYTNEERIREFGGYAELTDTFSWTGDGAAIKFDYVETIEEDDSQLVVIQLYSDMTFLLKSHKVGYRFSKDGVKWLGCEVLEKSRYEPYHHKSLKED